MAFSTAVRYTTDEDRLRGLLRRCTVSGLTMLLIVAAAGTHMLAAQRGRGGQVAPVPERRDRPTDGTTVPFPDSLQPDQIVANITSIAQQVKLADVMHLPEIATGELRARRVLQVKSTIAPNGYLV